MNKIARLKRVCWEEYRVAKQLSTGQSETYIATWQIPGWFIAEELGFGAEHGPSILWNLMNLERTNRRNRTQATAPSRKRRRSAAEMGRVIRDHVKRAIRQAVAR